MKLGLLPLVKYALLSAALAGCASFGDGSLNATEKVMFSTYPLFTDKIVGTCFFVAMKDPRNRNCYFPVVVTSKHMLKAAGKDRLFIPLRAIGADGKISFFLVRVGAVPGREPFYVGHPNFDVAAFPLLIPESLEPQFALRLLEGKNLVAEVRAGENVSFLGFPEGLPGTPDLFPVLRSGRIASYDPAGFASRHFLLNGDV